MLHFCSCTQAVLRRKTDCRSFSNCKLCPVTGAVATALQILVTGDSMQTISFSFRMGHSSVCEIIDNTCEAFWNVLSPEFVNAPESSEERRKISNGFTRLWHFPHCVGGIDGKHIMIQAPANAGSQYYNYKAQRVIENAFGRLCTKFRVYRRPIIAKSSKINKLVKASCA
uniref:DDE Tnp4 domain-containing protein n=1 Tax=Amphimedon queenslandica TaxID=400682 RepID=A0A1X7VQK7_AMPQE